VNAAVASHRRLKAATEELQRPNDRSDEAQMGPLGSRLEAARARFAAASDRLTRIEEGHAHEIARFVKQVIEANLRPERVADPRRTIVIEGFRVRVKKREMRPHLAQVGTVADMRTIEAGGGFAFLVTFKRAKSAVEAIAKFNGRRLNGVRLNVHWDFGEGGRGLSGEAPAGDTAVAELQIESDEEESHIERKRDVSTGSGLPVGALKISKPAIQQHFPQAVDADGELVGYRRPEGGPQAQEAVAASGEASVQDQGPRTGKLGAKVESLEVEPAEGPAEYEFNKRPVETQSDENPAQGELKGQSEVGEATVVARDEAAESDFVHEPAAAASAEVSAHPCDASAHEQAGPTPSPPRLEPSADSANDSGVVLVDCSTFVSWSRGPPSFLQARVSRATSC
jgi:hypothetical protein